MPVKGHFVVELAVVPRDTGNNLGLFPFGGAVGVKSVHLGADEALTAVVGMGSDKFGAATGKGYIFIEPCL